jgi:mono/diheme cytochrome c family protein
MVFRFIAFSLLPVALFVGATPGKSQLQTVPGSAVRGEQVLTNSGCVSCHALNGKGGTRGPDLATPSKTASTPSLFATSLWNHFPMMLAEFRSSNTPAPVLRHSDVADLFAYFYATLYFAPRGNATRGGNVFLEKGCSSCHSEILDTSQKKSFVETWMDLNDPSIWAERMWNHATEMGAAMANRGIRWPNMSDQDVADLVTFLSTRANTRIDAYAFTVGEPDLGKAVFEESCSTCHSISGTEKGKIDLLTRKGARSIVGYVATMWNHAPEMRRRGPIPKLKDGTMADLVAFLFSSRYFFEPGNVDRGKQVYRAKNCALCHESRRRELGAPDLSKSVEAFSPITLTAAAWSHGDSMIKTMQQQRIPWPEFKGREMADLIAYLNSTLIVKVAGDRQPLSR